MLSSLSTLADRNFIVGFLLPALIASVIFTWIFQDYAFVAPVWELVRTADGLASLTLFAIAVWALATLLSVFNIQLHRLLEGYYGPLSGTSRSKAFVEKFKACQKALDLFATRVDRNPNDKDLRAQYLKRYARSQLDYPLREEHVMPTRFGNVLSAMETYSLHHYGADGTALWSRLIAAMPENYQKVVDGGRAEVDFFVSSVFLSLALSLLCALSFFWSLYGAWHDSTAVAWLHLAAAGGFAALAFVCYAGGIVRARSWGTTIRSAYDLYLSDLAKLLGYQEPSDPAERRKFWTAYSSMVAYAMPVDPKYRGTPEPKLGRRGRRRRRP